MRMMMNSSRYNLHSSSGLVERNEVSRIAVHWMRNVIQSNGFRYKREGIRLVLKKLKLRSAFDHYCLRSSCSEVRQYAWLQPLLAVGVLCICFHQQGAASSMGRWDKDFGPHLRTLVSRKRLYLCAYFQIIERLFSLFFYFQPK